MNQHFLFLEQAMNILKLCKSVLQPLMRNAVCCGRFKSKSHHCYDDILPHFESLNDMGVHYLYLSHLNNDVLVMLSIYMSIYLAKNNKSCLNYDK